MCQPRAHGAAFASFSTSLPIHKSTHHTLLSQRNQIASCKRQCFSVPAVIFVTPPKITKDAATNPSSVIRLIQHCASGGLSAIQLRDPLCESIESFRLTQALIDRALMEFPSPPYLLINGPGERTHFPERLIEELARQRQSKSEALLGCSVHSVQTAKRAIKAGASYLQVGTMFSTKSHPGKQLEGLQLMRNIRREVGESALLIGVGGINLSNAEEVMKAGADGIAVISAISDADDVKQATVDLVDYVKSSKSWKQNRKIL